MQVSDVLLHILIIIISARVLGEIVTLFGAPSVIGELIAGIIIGPSLLGWVEINEIIHLLGELGVILLLFGVGLDTDFDRLVKSGRKSLIVAVGGFIAPFLFGYLVCTWVFDLPLITSLFVGGTLTATSIGITVRTLSDIGQQNSKEGQITLGAAVLDDILGVILLALLYEFSVSGGINIANTARVFLFITLFFLLAPILAKVFYRLIQVLDKHDKNKGLIPTTIIAIVLFFAWLAHLFGAPELLGGFAAGLALSKRFFLPFGLAISSDADFSKKVKDQVSPIIQLFTPIFFVSVGLSLNLQTIEWTSPIFWSFSLLVAVIAIVTKFTGAMLIQEPLPRRVAIGMSMVPRGEVGLIFTGLGVTAGVFSNDIYTALIMVIAYTTLLSPFWIKFYYKRIWQISESPTKT